VNKREPLRTELEAYLATVRGEKVPIVEAEDGLRALRLARAIVRSGLENRPLLLEE
jgi:predicted dehydrogenase